jgi:hypothetical protein
MGDFTPIAFLFEFLQHSQVHDLSKIRRQITRKYYTNTLEDAACNGVIEAFYQERKSKLEQNLPSLHSAADARASRILTTKDSSGGTRARKL